MQAVNRNSNHSNFIATLFSKPMILLSILLLSIQVASSQEKPAQQAYSVEYMTGSADMHGVRLAYRPDIEHKLDLPLIGDTLVQWEASLNLFDVHGSAKNEATYGVSISPVFIKDIPSFSADYPLSAEFGIGVAYVHREKFGGVDIGSLYQFEDRLGIVMGLDKESESQVALRYIHYSNGGFNTTNPGLDFLSVAYISKF